MEEKVLSVGIDIGTSTMCVIFSNLYIENRAGGNRMPEAVIAKKEILYRSPIYFTPLISDTELNAGRIAEIIRGEYESAQVRTTDVRTGAVIITGDTARKSNAQSVINRISDIAGDFVVAAVGPDLESILAGKGSGAESYSRTRPGVIANFDIGGGTTNIASFEGGNVVDADCMDVGGRLIRFERESLTVEYVYPKIAKTAAKHGIEIKTGNALSPAQITAITDYMATAVMEKAVNDGRSEDFFALSTNEKEKDTYSCPPIDTVSFSGGVGKLIYDDRLPEDLEYGDIGVYLAKSIKKIIANYKIKIVAPAETIGATVIGAGSHSMEVSGATITISESRMLPLKNIPILKMGNIKDLTDDQFKELITKNIEWMQGSGEAENVALAVDWGERMKFNDIVSLAEQILSGAGQLVGLSDQPLIVILKDDFGRVLGQTLQRLLPQGKEVFCIDGVNVGNGDYLDIGKQLAIGNAVPVVVKTLAFSY